MSCARLAWEARVRGGLELGQKVGSALGLGLSGVRVGVRVSVTVRVGVRAIEWLKYQVLGQF